MLTTSEEEILLQRIRSVQSGQETKSIFETKQIKLTIYKMGDITRVDIKEKP